MFSQFQTRYDLAPQMRDYDRLSVHPVPYLGFFQSPRYRSPSVNTDDRGFRLPGAEGLKKSDPDWYLFGGSAAFGVGASSDDTTLSAQISYESGLECVNAGGRAFTSTQELLSGLYLINLRKAKRIYLFSGVNDLVIYYMSRYWSPLGSQFFWQRTRSSYDGKNFIRKFVCRVLKLFFREPLNIEALSIRDYLLNRMGRLPIEKVRGLHVDDGVGRDIIQFEDEDPRIVSVLAKNLEIWRQTTLEYGTEIVYCLQPYLPWTSKALCDEEKTLTNLDMPGQKSWSAARDKMDTLNTYKWYRQEIQNVCDNIGVKFIDLNPILEHSTDWCFVDNVHLTDQGYKLCAKKLISL